MSSVYRVMFALIGLIALGGAAAQDAQLTQNAPVGLESFALNAEDTTAELSVRIANEDGGRPVVAVAVGVVMVDAFNDVITIHYARWTNDLGTLAPGESAELTSSFVEPRAGDLFLSVPFIYAVRFGDGEVWKENLNHVATELLYRFEVAAGSSTLQP